MILSGTCPDRKNCPAKYHWPKKKVDDWNAKQSKAAAQKKKEEAAAAAQSS